MTYVVLCLNHLSLEHFFTLLNDFFILWVGSFLKERNYIFNIFQVFRIHVGKQLGSSMQFLCSDGGGEYTFKAFHHYCKKMASINNLHNLTYMSHQNGVAQ